MPQLTRRARYNALAAWINSRAVQDKTKATSLTEGNTVLAEYLPSLLFLLVATGIGIVLMLVGRTFGPHSPDAQKLSPYECGFEAFENARMKFDVRYYLIAIQFIVFDLEIIFIVPWTQVFMDIGARSLVTMGLFVGMLFLGFIYVWKKGALEWE